GRQTSCTRRTPESEARKKLEDLLYLAGAARGGGAGRLVYLFQRGERRTHSPHSFRGRGRPSASQITTEISRRRNWRSQGRQTNKGSSARRGGRGARSCC